MIDVDDFADEMPEDDVRCSVCGAELDFGDRDPCDDCTGLRRCVDDICHGSGYCIHDPEAFIP